MDAINFIAPLDVIPNANDTEAAYHTIFSQLFNGTPNVLTVNDAILLINGLPFSLENIATQGLNQSLLDLINYGCPHLGSQNVVERFSKQNGLVALRQSSSNDQLMRVILENWIAHGSKRGLNFLAFVLDFLFPNQWTLTRLFHSIEHKDFYPSFLSETDDASTFLTSRLRVDLDAAVDVLIASELVPSLLRLIPANMVVGIATPATIAEPLAIGCAVVSYGYLVADYSVFA